MNRKPKKIAPQKRPKTVSGKAAPKKTPQALATVDPLQRYLNQIGQYELLTPEREHDFAVQFSKTRDPKAAYELTVRNLRLVVKIALEYRRAWSNVLDLIQEGNVGLMTAIQKFDPYRQTRLSTYAAWWIRAYILKFIMSNWRLIKIGNTQAERKLFYNLQRERERLLAEGFLPETKLLSERLNVKERDVVDMSRRLGTSELSLDQPQSMRTSSTDIHDGPTLGEVLTGEAVPLEDELARDEIRRQMRDVLTKFRETLTPRDQLLLDKRILPEEPATLQEIGDQWSISRERVRQLEVRVIEKLKKFIAETNPGLKLAIRE